MNRYETARVTNIWSTLFTAQLKAYSRVPWPKLFESILILSAAGEVLGFAVTPAAKDPHLVIMYASLAGAMGVVTIVLMWRFLKYDREKDGRGAVDSVKPVEEPQRQGQSGSCIPKKSVGLVGEEGSLARTLET